jgi:hypothetical protein
MLYHLCTSHGYAYAVDQNALKSLRHTYVSTTYDPFMNGVTGHWHIGFKFVLNGPALAAKYGVRDVDFHTQEIGANGRRRHVSLKEREVGIVADEISPLTDYLLGTVLLFDIFSQKALQDLLYDHSAYKGFLDNQQDAAPRGIEVLFRQIETGVPIWVKEVGRLPTQQEMLLLKAVKSVHDRGGDFREGMRKIAEKFPLRDHDDKLLDRRMVERRQKSEKLTDVLNKFYVGKQRSKIKPEQLKGLLVKLMRMLGLTNNAEAVVVHAAEQAGLFHPMMAPVNWTGILRPLMDGDIEESLSAIKWYGEELKPLRSWYENSELIRSGSHYGTKM